MGARSGVRCLLSYGGDALRPRRRVRDSRGHYKDVFVLTGSLDPAV